MYKIDLDNLAKKIGAPLPESLSILNFIDLGKMVERVGQDSHFNLNCFVYSSNKNIPFDRIIIDHFIPNENLESYWMGRTQSDLWEDFDKYIGLAISTEPKGTWIVISLNARTFGSIWLEFPEPILTEGLETKRLFLEKDFISFLSKLNKEYFDDRFGDILPEDQLYKKWGEDFWRVKDK